MKIKQKSTVSKAGSAFTIVMLVALSIVFNFFPDKVGVYSFSSTGESFRPLLAAAFEEHMPLLNLWWGLAFSFHLANLLSKTWSPLLNAAHVVVNLIGVFAMFVVALTPHMLLSGAELTGMRTVLALGAFGLFVQTVRSARLWWQVADFKAEPAR